MSGAEEHNRLVGVVAALRAQVEALRDRLDEAIVRYSADRDRIDSNIGILAGRIAKLEDPSRED